MVTIIQAIYEDGVLKPLEPLELTERQIVQIRIEVISDGPQKITKLGGIWAEYGVGEALSFEEIQALTSDEHKRSLERTLKQVAGDFEGDNGIGS